jgi:hypothetical protein
MKLTKHERDTLLGACKLARSKRVRELKKDYRNGWTPEPGKTNANAKMIQVYGDLIERLEA